MSLLRNQITMVYDITLFYEDFVPGERPSEGSILQGRMPRVLRFYLQGFPISEIPENDRKCGEWLISRFDRKEKMLKSYYEENKFPEKAVKIWKAEDRSLLHDVEMLSVWSISCSLMVYLLFTSTFFRIYVVIVTGFYLWYGDRLADFVLTQCQHVKEKGV